MISQSRKKFSLGAVGEEFSSEYLKAKGYTILARNYRRPWGEVDIVARAPDRTLVFVEVKTLRSRQGFHPKLAEGPAPSNVEGLKPEDQMTSAKLKKLRRTCEKFALTNPDLVDENKGWRIDVVAIEVAANGENIVRHHENV
jgi:putative endonuclease